jgi:cytochrome d ubiquinol oxidase subunit II
MEFLQVIWFLLIVVLLLGYSILDGFDLGIGVLTPFLAKGTREKRVLYNAVGPLWDGNEVWLLTGGGALFAAFPPVYATVFSGFYLALMLVLFALIFRAVSLEFWSYDEKNRKFWSWAFVIGSFLPSLLYGVALGNVMQGIPLNQNFDFTGNFFTLLRPFPLAAGLLGLFAVLIQGSTFAALKSEGQLRENARKITSTLGIIFIIVFLLAVILGALIVEGAAGRIFAWLFVLVVLFGWWMTRQALKKDSDLKAFLMSSLVHVGIWGIVASVMFPNLVRASNDPALNMTLYNSSSSQLTLTVMLIIALVGVPIVLGYTIYVYRIFKGKVTPPALEENL